MNYEKSDDMQDKELMNVTIDKYMDLQRILKADDPKKEAAYQLKVAKVKLEAYGIVTEDLELD